MSRILIAIVAVLALSSGADACSRCGHYGTSCRYYRAPYIAPIVKNYVTSPDVFVVQNNYPAPLVAQGATQYLSNGGYQAAVLPLLDPNQYFSQEMQLIKAATETQALRTERTASLFQKTMELQSSTVERLAAGQAAQMVLQASGLDPAHNTAGGENAVVISRNAQGLIQVLPLSGAQAQQLVSSKLSRPIGNAAVTRPNNSATPLLEQFCFKCHGLDVAQPKAGFYLGADVEVAKKMKDSFYKITRMVANHKMPPADSAQPTDQERAGILNEVEAIIASADQEKAVPKPPANEG